MKYCWRITKYNPEYRNEYGHYSKDSWTTYSEVGRICDGKIVTIEDYLLYENLYIQTIILFMNCLDISKLYITHLWKSEQIKTDKYTTPKMKHLWKIIENNSWVNKHNVPTLVSLILRDQLWCQLSYPYRMHVDFGYDFYMYIESRKSSEEVIKAIETSGLYIEPFKSPYRK